MTTDIENRQIRIFISSTFRDMMAERDYLVTKVFPALRRYCEERDVSLFELDLRWGISEEESRQGKVVDICLKEIRKTTPFFIGLLGERYGWIPSEAERGVIAANSNVFEEYPWLGAELAEGTSITEIEIQEGVLRAVDKINAYFYFRSPRMETPAAFREQPGSHEERMLSELKKILRGQDACPVKDYDSAEHLGHLVEADFKALVDKLFPLGALSPLEKERLEQRRYLKNRTAVYVPRPGWYAKLDAFVEQDGGSAAARCLVVSGETGMGKSALLANWAAKRQRDGGQPGEKIIYHGIGAGAAEGDYRKIIRRLTAELRDFAALPAEDTVPAEAAASDGTGGGAALTAALQTLLFAAANAPADRGGPLKRLIIVLDGMDQLVDTDNAKALAWLPAFPENVRVIFSAASGDETIAACTRREYETFTLGPLPLESRKLLVAEYLASFGKGLLPAQVERIARSSESENPLALRAVLDELRVFGVHEKINAQIDKLLAAPDMESLFALVLERLETLFGGSLVTDVFSLIAASRSGLSEAELLALTRTAPLYWSQLYAAAAGHLAERNGLVSMAHRFLYGAVKRRYFAAPGAEEACRLRIAAWFESAAEASPARVRAELPHQYRALGDWDKLCAFLLDLDVFEHIYRADKYELGAYWRALREADGEKYLLLRYLERNQPGDGAACNGKSAEELGLVYEHLSYLAAIILSDYPAALEYGEAAVSLKEAALGQEHPALADACLSAAMVCGILKDKEKARDYRRRALEIREAVYGKEHPATAKALYYYAMTFRSDTALEYTLEALAVQEKTLGINHADTAWSYANAGRCYFAREQYGEALEYEQKALNIRETLFGTSHPDTVDSYTNISAPYLALEDHHKALEYAALALKTNLALYGKIHFWIARSHEALGSVYALTDNDEKALEHIEAAIDVWDVLFEKWGRNSAEKAEALNLQGLIFDRAGDKAKAREHFTAAWEMSKTVRGEDHPQTREIQENLAALEEE